VISLRRSGARRPRARPTFRLRSHSAPHVRDTVDRSDAAVYSTTRLRAQAGRRLHVRDAKPFRSAWCGACQLTFELADVARRAAGAACGPGATCPPAHAAEVKPARVPAARRHSRRCCQRLLALVRRPHRDPPGAASLPMPLPKPPIRSFGSVSCLVRNRLLTNVHFSKSGAVARSFHAGAKGAPGLGFAHDWRCRARRDPGPKPVR
jgi:hypothetical protein